MIVLSWSKATRDLLKSLGWGIRALHQLGTATMVPSPRRLPHTISLLEGDGFEPSVPRQKDNAFRDSSLPTCARAAAAFENARRPVQQLLLPVVDPVRMNAELARQLGDRPVPPTATTHPFAFITALRFFRVRSISCSCAVAGRIGFGG